MKLAADEHVLLLNFHHIAFDGWSFGVFEEELAVLYNAFLRAEEASPLPELPFQYVDFAAWQRQWLEGKVLQEQLDYWQRKLVAPSRFWNSPLIIRVPQFRPTTDRFPVRCCPRDRLRRSRA